MASGFIVCRGHGWEKRYFSKFVDRIPLVSFNEKRAMIFEHREMAEDVAKRCEEHSGRKYMVKEVNDDDHS